MNQAHFERAREAGWAEFEAAVLGLGTPTPGFDFPSRYRGICRDLALARDRGFSASLLDRLNHLALQGHQRLYAARPRPGSPLGFFAGRFPRAMRREWRLMGGAALLFYGTCILSFGLVRSSPELIYSLMSAEDVAQYEEMYDPEAAHYGTPRDTVGDFSAFAYYTSHNTGIALRTFAWGLFAGVGSLVLLVLNGMYIGVVAAHISAAGNAVPFFSFVIAHGAFELTALVMAGATGMRLGWALVAPGASLRSVALRQAARRCVPLLYGMVAMLVVAAVIEGFWSSSRDLPVPLKFGAGAATWIFVAAWLSLGGRTRAD